MMATRSRWNDHNHWQCLKHVPPVKLPSSSARCWFVGCSARPSEEERPVWVAPVERPAPVDAPVVALRSAPSARRTTAQPSAPASTQNAAHEGSSCALESCANQARGGSKYCSRACSNRNARRRFKAKMKAA